MLFVSIAVLGLSAIAAVAILGRREDSLATTRPVRSASPIDEAERILSRRYARGEITAEEYDRMLVILRR